MPTNEGEPGTYWTDAGLDAVLDDERPPPRPTWKRSRRSNLWRRWRGLRVIVFKDRDDLYGWCIAGGQRTGRPGSAGAGGPWRTKRSRHSLTN
jgi:hypothetical protein